MDDLRIVSEHGETALYYREHELIRFKRIDASRAENVKRAVALALADHEAALAAEREANDAELEKFKTIMMAAAVEIKEHWDAHCDAEGYGPVNLLRRLESGLHGGGYAYTAEDWIACRARIAELEREKVELFDAGTALKAELASIRTAIEAMTREWKEYGSRLLNDNHYATRAIGRCAYECASELLALLEKKP